MKLHISPVILLLVCTSCEAQRVTEWKQDLEFWKKEVKAQHYVYHSAELPKEFDAQFERTLANLPSYSDQRVAVELLGLSALLGDGHTYVIPWSAQKVQTMALPFRFFWFKEGLYIIDASPGHEEWMGKKVAKIGSLSGEELMKRVGRFISRDNDQGINWVGPVMLPLEGMLQAIGVEGKSKYSMTLEGEGPAVVKEFPVVPFQPVRGIPKLIPCKLKGVPTPLYLKDVSGTFQIQSLQTPRTLYVQFNQVMDDPGESLSQFSKRLSDSIATRKPSKLIVDVRHNNGGNEMLLAPLLEVLRGFTSDPANRLYILTGRNTFSAAQIFITRAEKLKPVYAGELSSSKPNFVGEENVIQLPNSKIICSISNRYHETIPGDTRQAIEPEIKFTPTAADYFSGRDGLLEAVLKR